jgi:hypothetical protein
MERFEEMCKDGLLGLGDYGLFKDWSAIDRSRDAYIRIRDGLVSEGWIIFLDDPCLLSRLRYNYSTTL